MKLTLIDDDDEILAQWLLGEDPDVFCAVRDALYHGSPIAKLLDEKLIE